MCERPSETHSIFNMPSNRKQCTRNQKFAKMFLINTELDATEVQHEDWCISSQSSVESSDSRMTSDEFEATESDDETDLSQANCFKTSFYFQTKLLKILHDANAPLYLFKRNYRMGSRSNPSEQFYLGSMIKSQEGSIKQINNWMPYMQQNSPYQIRTFLPTLDTYPKRYPSLYSTSSNNFSLFYTIPSYLMMSTSSMLMKTMYLESTDPPTRF